MAINNPLITICIPTYNRAQYIGQTIESVLNQTYSKLELLIVNDASTDETENIISKFKDKRIRYEKNSKNLGYIKSMRKGNNLSKGQWIMFLSDDDRMLPQMLEEMTNAMKENQNKEIGFVVPQTININSEGGVISIPKKQLIKKKYIVLNPKEFIFNFTLYGKKIRNKYSFNTSFPSTLFNKSILNKLGGSSNDLPVSHDIFIESKICLLFNILVVDDPLFEYRVHDNLGSSLNRTGSFIPEYTRFLNMLFKFVEDQKITFNYNFINYCYESLVTYLFKTDGGLVRFAARYTGEGKDKLRIITSYIKFGVSKNKKILLTPSFYLVIVVSFLPRHILLWSGKMFRKI